MILSQIWNFLFLEWKIILHQDKIPKLKTAYYRFEKHTSNRLWKGAITNVIIRKYFIELQQNISNIKANFSLDYLPLLSYDFDH